MCVKERKFSHITTHISGLDKIRVGGARQPRHPTTKVYMYTKIMLYNAFVPKYNAIVPVCPNKHSMFSYRLLEVARRHHAAVGVAPRQRRHAVLSNGVPNPYLDSRGPPPPGYGGPAHSPAAADGRPRTSPTPLPISRPSGVAAHGVCVCLLYVGCLGKTQFHYECYVQLHIQHGKISLTNKL